MNEGPLIWKPMVEAACDVYDSPNRFSAAGVEFSTEKVGDLDCFIFAGTNAGKSDSKIQRLAARLTDWARNCRRGRKSVTVRGRKVKVHSGYWEGAGIAMTHLTAFAERHEEIGIIGHSAGAAEAALAGIQIESRFPGKIKRLCCAAMPRIGNQALSNAFESLFPMADRYRLYGRKRDPICFLPVFGYKFLAPITWLPSKLDGKLDHGCSQYAQLVNE